jgi:hypothetical protein
MQAIGVYIRVEVVLEMTVNYTIFLDMTPCNLINDVTCMSDRALDLEW